jgi:hypothetical protein
MGSFQGSVDKISLHGLGEEGGHTYPNAMYRSGAKYRTTLIIASANFSVLNDVLHGSLCLQLQLDEATKLWHC